VTVKIEYRFMVLANSFSIDSWNNVASILKEGWVPVRETSGGDGTWLVVLQRPLNAAKDTVICRLQRSAEHEHESSYA